MHVHDDTHLLEEKRSAYSDTDSENSSDSETSCSGHEWTTTRTEVDDVASVIQPELSLISSLKRVFVEVGSFADDDSRLLTVAVHAIMLHYGFVLFVPGFPSPNQSVNTAIRITYTLPEVQEMNKTDAAVLIFQNSGNFFNIRASLIEKQPLVHQLTLNRNRFVPPFDLTFVNSDMIDARIQLHGSSSDQYPENEVLEFSRLVNDTLIYPLLIDLRQKAGLLPPPCFMRLPPELKLKILEFLDGVDTARAECVCSELRNLSSNNDNLWKRKCADEFGLDNRHRRGRWKNVYAHGHSLRS